MINDPIASYHAPTYTTDQGHTLVYMPKNEIQFPGSDKSQDFDDTFVDQLPLCCVQVLVPHPFKNCYLQTEGNVIKGESFFACTIRTCQKIGLEVTVEKVLGVLSKIFPGSKPNTQVHTINTIVIATLNKEVYHLDENYKWNPTDQWPPQKDIGHTRVYLENIQLVGMVNSKEFYRQAVAHRPIACVDVFLYNPFQNTYLLVLRKDPPAKGIWWVPGGRLFKGENFEDCAIRKCKDEVGLEVTAEKILGVLSTIFPDSMWETQTHTVNTIVLAKLNADLLPTLDQTCQSHTWNAIDQKPEDPYVLKVYTMAREFIKT